MNKHWALVFVLLLSTMFVLSQGQAQNTLTARLERQVGLGNLLDVVFLRDNKTLISSSSRGMTYWDAATRKQIRTIEMDGHVNQMAVSRDGKWLAAAISNGVALYEAPTGKFVTKLMNISSQAVAFSPNNKWLATGSDDGIVRLWDMATRKASSIIEFFYAGRPKPSCYLETVGFTADSTALFADAASFQLVTSNQYAYGFSAMDLSQRKFTRVEIDFRLSLDQYFPSGFAVHPDNKTYYFQNRIFNFTQDGPLFKFDDPLFFAQDWKVAVNRKGAIINPANGQSILQLDLPIQPGDIEADPDHWAFSPDGRYLVAALGDQRILVYDAKRFVFLGDIRDHLPTLTELAIHPTLPIAALTGGNRGESKVRLLNLETGAFKTQTGDYQGIAPLAFSPQGDLLLMGRLGLPFQATNMTVTEKVVIDLYAPNSDYSGPATWTPDGTQLLIHKDRMIYSKSTDQITPTNEVEYASTEGAMSDIDRWVKITILNCQDVVDMKVGT